MPQMTRFISALKYSQRHPHRVLSTLMGCLLIYSGSTLAVSCPDPLESLGGEAWRQVQQVSWHSQGQNFEPAQSFHPGAEGRHVSDDNLVGRWQPAELSGELNWQLDTYYPFPGHWEYQESLGETNRLQGSDGFRPAGAELQTTRRHLRWINTIQRFPALLFLAGEYHSGENVCNLQVQHPSGLWRVWLNPATGLPRRVVHQEQDPLYGMVENVVSYDHWHQQDGLQVAAQIEQEVNNHLIRREKLDQYSIQLSATPLEPSPAALERMAGNDVPEWARERSHWFQRRIAAGAPMDDDPAGKVEFVEITPELFQITGGSHHSLVLVGRITLVVVEAPWGPRRSDAVIKALAQRWPDKPISHLILTHHHEDHSAGLMRFVEAGATLVMGVPTRHYFGTVFAKSGRRNIPNKTVANEYRLNALGELVELYHVPNSHAEGMLLVYSRKDKTVFTSDLFSPGRTTQSPLWARELLNTVEWLGLDVEHIVGGHGHGAVGMEALRQAAVSSAPASTLNAN